MLCILLQEARQRAPCGRFIDTTCPCLLHLCLAVAAWGAVLLRSLLQHMMESLKKQGAVGGGGGGGGIMGALPGGLSSLGGLGGGLTGMAAGMAAGMLASFVLGPGAMGGQVPVLSCDKQVDIHQTRLAI